ncbi:MAG: hypothetical protein IBX47_08520 [Desulfuromonadales bacterium]|nr:hypothetical protein [Desulfuromonadales bacterium]
MFKAGFILLIAFMILLPSMVLAFDFKELQINGFISQGYLKSSYNNWLAVDSVDGTLQINEVGITLTAPVTQRLRVGMQLLSRDLGDEGNNEVRLDWAFGDYRISDSFGLRLGKVKMPIGLYNEGRDSDFLRNMAFLPQSVYDETRRNLLVASQGLQIYGNIPLSAAGDLDYAAHYGQIHFPEDSPTLDAFLGFANMGAGWNPLAPAPNPSPWNRISADNEYVYGGQLRYNTPLDGLRLAGSFFEGKADFSLNDSNGTTPAGNLRVKIHQMYVASLEYATPWFTLSSEYVQYKQPAWLNGTEFPSGTSVGMYGMLAIPFPGQENVCVVGMYDVYYSDEEDKSGTRQALIMGGAAYDYYRKDVGAGVRWDLNDFWLIKAEYHKVIGAALLTQYFNANMAVKNWDYYAVKTSFNF